MTAFLVWTRWIQGIWKPAEMGCQSIIKAGLDSSLFYFLLLFFFFQIFLCLILDWPFSQFCSFFSFSWQSFFFPWLTLLFLTEIIFERAHHGKHIWNAHAWAVCRFICKLLEQGPGRICFIIRRRRGIAVNSGVFAITHIPNEIDVLELNMVSWCFLLIFDVSAALKMKLWPCCYCCFKISRMLETSYPRCTIAVTLETQEC